jgi:rhodanese-related sulfurtransferase
MKTIRLFGILALIISVLAACTGIYEDGHELAQDTKKSIEQIDVEALNKILEEGGDYVLIDVRQPAEYYTNNIPGSVLIPRGVLELKIADENFWFDQYLYPPTDSTLIITYCKVGDRGTLAAKSLLEIGYKNVKNLNGGYNAYNPNQDPNAKPQASSGCGG